MVDKGRGMNLEHLGVPVAEIRLAQSKGQLTQIKKDAQGGAKKLRSAKRSPQRTILTPSEVAPVLLGTFFIIVCN